MDQLTNYSPAEAADILGTSRVTIHKMIKEGQLKSFKVRRLRRISQDAIDEFIRNAEAEEASK